MYASSEQECIRRDAGDVKDWKETLEEFDHYQNAMRYQKSIRRLAIRDMATLGFPDNRRMFHKQSDDEKYIGFFYPWTLKSLKETNTKMY